VKDIFKAIDESRKGAIVLDQILRNKETLLKLFLIEADLNKFIEILKK